ncbi:MAG: tRNA (adenosine(37)-N6)-threonylcarbamoyltransferase complex ATPase subunit type 1 TsaE [Candidatus Kryptoniota bacterium]
MTGIFVTRGEVETIALGEKFGNELRSGDFVAMYGDIGAGKTHFVQGVCRALNVKEVVNSPTFTIINEYHGKLDVYHIDLYRVSSLKEILDLGFEEYLDAGAVCIVEWAEKLNGIMPEKRYEVTMTIGGENIRNININQV